MDVHVQVLGSSSSGNSTLIWDENHRLLIDFGFGIRYLQTQLEKLGFSLDGIDAAFITHTHYDHVKPTVLKRFAKNRTPVYCPPAMQDVLREKYPVATKVDFRTMNGSLQPVLGFTVRSFDVPHDVYGGCVGYVFRSGEKKIVLSTDLGFVTPEIEEHFVNADVIVIESNYDPQMLENSNRSRDLIERIKTIGHLSNGQSADFVVRVAARSVKKPRAVVLAHLSQECNLPHLAVNGLQRRLKESGLDEITVAAAPAKQPGPRVSI